MTGPESRLQTITVPEREQLFASPFCFRADLPETEDDPLVISVAAHGLINLPIILSTKGKQFQIVTGHRRLAAARVAGLVEVAVVAVEADIRDTVAHWVEDAPNGAPLSDLEKIVLIEIAGSLAGGLDAAFYPGLSSLFGREVTGEFASQLTSLLALDREILASLHKGTLSTGDLLLLQQHPILDTAIAASILAGGRLSRAGRKEAIRLMMNLADQGEDRWTAFVDDLEMSSMPLVEALRKECYPSLEKDLGEIRSIISEIGLPKGAAIHPPENLEGGSLQFTLRIRDEKEVSIAAGKLIKAVEDGSVNRLLDILKG